MKSILAAAPVTFPPLANAKKLETVNVSNVNAEQLTAVVTERKKTLKSLTVAETTMGSELCTAIGECAKLTTLTLGEVENVEIPAICNAGALTNVIVDTADNCDFAQLGSLKKLQELSLANLHNASFQGLESLPKVSKLYLGTIEADDLSFIANCPKLETLEIMQCTTKSFQFLNELVCAKTLTQLSIMGLELEDAAFVASLPKLNALILCETLVRKIPPLDSLKKLEALVLVDCPIEDYTPILTCSAKAIALSDTLNGTLLSYYQNRLPQTYFVATNTEALLSIDVIITSALFNGKSDEEAAKMREEKDKILEEANAKAFQVVSKILEAEKQALIDNMEELATSEMQITHATYYLEGYGADDYVIESIDTDKAAVMIPESVDGKNIVGLYSAHIYGDVSVIGIPATIEHIVSGLAAEKTTAYVVDQDNPNYAEADGAIYSKDLKTLVAYPSANSEFTIPDTVTSVGGGLFTTKI